jgi:molybdate transport repressor ModE-like protein
MKIVPVIGWRLDEEPGETLDPRLLALLAGIENNGSLTGAVAAGELSYRGAWGLVRRWELRLDAPLVVFERGRGAHLAPAGQRLLDAQRRADSRLARGQGLAVELDARPRKSRSTQALSVAASHDLVLAALRERADGRDPKLDVAFTGSIDALTRFAEGRVEVAGFHVPLASSPRELKPFRRWLDSARDRLLPLVDREQGLIVARGNPQRLRTLADVAARRLRFINRQRGSGTRLLIDRMLDESSLAGADLLGYEHEEFTHAAVAATVAAGAADAGFGLRAAAVERGLSFVPLSSERYYFAARASALRAPPVAALLDWLDGQALPALVRRFAGYRLAWKGRAQSVSALGKASPEALR